MNVMTDQSKPVSEPIESPLLKDFEWISIFNLGTFVTDDAWKLTSWNTGFLQTLDIKPTNDLRNQDVFHLMGFQDYKPEMTINQVKTLSFTLPGTSKSLELRTVSILKDGEIYGLGVISNHSLAIQDEEWCNRFQYELIKNQQNHILEKRLEGLIHNINTPLNTIIGYVQILLRENPDSKALQKIMESGFQIDASLKSVHDKIEANRSRFIQQIDVNNVIKNELEIGRNNLFFKHNVHLELTLAENLPLVNMVYGDLSYCLDAVLWNAIESLESRETKSIYIETKMQNERLQIIVKDTGSGILPKDMPFIYEYGFSTKKDQNTEHLGLGLSFTRQIIQDYRGTIVINSEFQEGTTVTLDLPLEDNL
jgi:signal transduction histidine kinase